MKNKICLGTMILLSGLSASEITISENFRQHACTKIDGVFASKGDGTKEELFDMLKEQTKTLGGNSIIEAQYDSDFFGMRNIARGVAANCDIAKSPSFFLKSDYTNHENRNLFLLGSVSNESVEMSKGDQKEAQSSSGMNIKIGMMESNYRYYGAFNFGVGMQLLGSADYIFQINDKISLFAGGSIGSSQYELSQGSQYVNSLISGMQMGVRYKDFELEAKTLKGISSSTIDGVSYKPNSITLLSLGYYF